MCSCAVKIRKANFLLLNLNPMNEDRMGLPTFDMPDAVYANSTPSNGSFGFLTANTTALTNWLGLNTTKLVAPSAAFQPKPHMFWVTCRESLHGYYETYEKGTGFGTFWYSMGEYKAAVEMVEWMEAQLGTEPVKISLKENYKVAPHQLKPINILQVELTDFWKLNEMRFQFFTAVIKTGLVNYACGGDPIAALKASKYFKDNFEATQRFMAGANWFDRPVLKPAEGTTTVPAYPHGWLKHFSLPGKEKQLRTPTDDDVRNRAYFLWRERGGNQNEQWEKAKKDIAPR